MIEKGASSRICLRVPRPQKLALARNERDAKLLSYNVKIVKSM
jgi:hypothetical protein